MSAPNPDPQGATPESVETTAPLQLASDDQRAWRLVAVAVPVLIVAFHWQAARPGWAFSGSDLEAFFFSLRDAVAGALRHGRLPLWQRGFFLGYPLAADPQAAVFDPATWLTLPWDAPRALTLATLLHLTWAGWGMAFWMRQRKLGPAPALLAAILFPLAAKQTAHLIHWNFAASTAWWPWMMAGLNGFARQGRGRFLALTAVSTAGAWLGGSPQMAYFGGLVAGMEALVLAPGLWRRRKIDAVLAVASLAIGTLMAAPLLFPTAELSALAPRGLGVDYRFATSWKWPDRWALSLLLLPRAYGGAYLPIGEMNLWEATGYVGILPLGLAAAAPLRRKGLWLWLSLAVIGIWLGFGEDSWLGLHRLLFRFLPGYGSFRCPTRSLMVTAFAASLLAAEGLAALEQLPSAGRVGRAMAALGLAATAALVLPRLPGFALDRAAGQHGAWIAAGLALAGIAWVAASTWTRLRALPWPALAAALAFVDLYVAFGGWNEVAPVEAERPVLSEFSPLVPEPPGPRRVALLTGWGAPVNVPLRHGWEGVTGYGPMCIERVRAVLLATQSGALPQPGPITTDTNFPRPKPTSPYWRLFAAPLLVSDEPQPLPEVGVSAVPQSGKVKVRRAYRTPALPRVFWTGAFEVRDDRSSDLSPALLRAAKGGPTLLASPIPGLEPSPGRPEQRPAEHVWVEDASLQANLDAPRPGLAVILDPFFPGWSATVDGVPAPVVRADYAFQAVPVPAGKHQLRMVYRSRLLPAGFAVAAVALGLFGLVLGWRRGRGQPAPAQ